MEYFINVSRTSEEYIKFKNMFNFSATVPDYKCDDCQNNKTQLGYEYDLKENKFLILSMSLTWKGKKSSSKILEFNPDYIAIPHDKFNNKYVLKAAITYESYEEGLQNENEKGHYKCWTKVSGGWLVISDSFADFRNSFDPYLENVYLLFLEKRKTSISVAKITQK